MNCPHCGKNISDKLIAKHLGSKGGSVPSQTKKDAAAKREKAKRDKAKKKERTKPPS